MKRFNKVIISLLLIISMLFCNVSCFLFDDALNFEGQGSTDDFTSEFYINGENRYTLSPGEKLTLSLTIDKKIDGVVEWTSSNSCVNVENGVVKAISHGTSVVKAILGEYSDSVIITVTGEEIEDSNTDNDIESDTDTDSTTDNIIDSTTDNTTDETTDSDTNDGSSNDFASGYDTITVAEALEIAEQYKNSASYERYYVVGTIEQISSASSGRMYIYDTTGTIYVYKSTMIDGSKVSSSSLKVGDVILISGTLRNYKGTLEIETGTIVDYVGNINPPSDNNDPYINVDVKEFYANYKPATSYEDAYYRTLHNLMSGTIAEQDQKPTISQYQPKINNKFVRNTEMIYSEDGNTYYVVNAYGDIVMEIYKGAAYIMLEEVAAYVFAFGEPPANQSYSKNENPTSSEWGEYLRLNHSSFSGNTNNYPYEPELPNISGCGGTLNYYEMDIGTTGTDCDPSYEAAIYNNGYTIVRGAARIVYVCEDDDRNGTIDVDERYVFYTYNHYNDFQEYLNYQGGWGKMFGNITGGGKISSKYDYNPTPYVSTAYADLTAETLVASVVFYCDVRKYYLCNI